MKVIVVTGGIASGKSTVVALLRELGGEGVECFDCDAAVEQLQQSGRLSRDLVAAFGEHALDEKAPPPDESNVYSKPVEQKEKLEEWQIEK